MDEKKSELKCFDRGIYDALIKAVEELPDHAVERTTKAMTRKGYDTTGYGYQFLVNVINEIVGPNGWGFEYHVIKEVVGQYKSGQSFYDVTVETRVKILDAERVCAGGHQSSSYSDALKGAITNSLKKTLGLFGIGKTAYEGTLDDDNVPLPDYPSNIAKKTSPNQYEADAI